MDQLNHPNQINRDYVRLLQAMRRFIKEEFSISIRMSQEDVITQLLHYGEQSRNSVLLEMSKELRELAYGPEPEAEQATEEKPQEGVRYYRGAPVADSKPAPEADTEEATSKEKRRPTRVYRGQVVYS